MQRRILQENDGCQRSRGIQWMLENQATSRFLRFHFGPHTTLNRPPSMKYGTSYTIDHIAGDPISGFIQTLRRVQSIFPGRAMAVQVQIEEMSMWPRI
jgi:hypothetical protein